VLQSKIKQSCGKHQLTIDETGRPESKEEENKSMEQLFEEEDEKEVEEEDEDEENMTEA
jgi:hypothetical protein